jgi:zinc transport system substrate-binding protein
MRLTSIVFAAFLASPVLADTPSVVTDIAPVHALVARVMQGIGSPELILRPGASPHGYALRPSDARAMQNADLIVWVGPSLTPWLENPLATLSESATQIHLMDLPGATVLPNRTDAVFAESTDNGHDHGHDHDHDSSGDDPHLWLDPQNAKVWTTAIAGALAQADPENAPLYLNNAETARSELDQLIADIRETLAPVHDLRFTVFHDAFQYFEARFDLHSTGAISDSDAASPSAARIAVLRREAQAQAVTCVFTEPQFNADVVAAIFEGTGVATTVLDPMGSHLDIGPALYPQLMRDLARNIAACQ